jgi:hypothetical protein
MLRRLLIATLALAALAAAALPQSAAAGRWHRTTFWGGPTGVLYPGWGYYSYPWGYVKPTAPYAYPVVLNCQRRFPVPRPWGVGWRETWVC